MWIKIITILFAGYMIIIQQCCGQNFVELPGFHSDDVDYAKDKDQNTGKSDEEPIDLQGNNPRTPPDYAAAVSDAAARYPKIRAQDTHINRRQLVTNPSDFPTLDPYKDKDASLKNKIATLVQQTMHDTDLKVKSVQDLKDSNREKAPYKIGFILSMVKKSRDVLNELFNVAVKHRNEWKALEQLKVFELIVHTNVDTTNLVRQLVEIHIQNLNATRGQDGRVVLL